MAKSDEVKGVLSKKKKYPPIEHMPSNPALGQMKKEDVVAWKKRYRAAKDAGRQAMLKAMLPMEESPTRENLKKAEEKNIKEKKSSKIDDLRKKLAEAQAAYDEKPSGGGKVKINKLNAELDKLEE